MRQQQGLIISVMLAVSDTPTAVEWYKRALGATVLWSLRSVAGLEIAGHRFSWENQRTTAGKARQNLGSRPLG